MYVMEKIEKNNEGQKLNEYDPFLYKKKRFLSAKTLIEVFV